MCGLMWVFFVSGLMKLRPENLYLNRPITRLTRSKTDLTRPAHLPCLNNIDQIMQTETIPYSILPHIISITKSPDHA